MLRIALPRRVRRRVQVFVHTIAPFEAALVQHCQFLYVKYFIVLLFFFKTCNQMSIAFVAGTLVIVVAAIKNINVRVFLHHLSHPGNWKALAHIRTDGVLEATRKHSITPLGFTAPSRWTLDKPTCPYAKHNAIPANLLHMLTCHHPITGQQEGTSIFIESGSYETRAPLKRIYITGLTTEAVQEYQQHMRHLSGSIVDSCSDALALSCRLTFLIHMNREPSDAEQVALVKMTHAITDCLNGIWTPDITNEKRLLRRCVFESTGGMIHRWVSAGMSKKDAYVEFAHNVFGMTIQWAHVIRRLSIKSALPPPSNDSEAAEFLLDLTPATVAASRVDGFLLLHDLKEICKTAKRPVRFAPSQNPLHVVHPDQDIAAEDDANYVPFGYGLRRCPGEWLTYKLVQTLRVIQSDGTTRGATTTSMRLGLLECE